VNIPFATFFDIIVELVSIATVSPTVVVVVSVGNVNSIVVVIVELAFVSMASSSVAVVVGSKMFIKLKN
jgi:hypothetical protein